jgi:hypothetical protein
MERARERRLGYIASGQWSGWVCERCGWKRQKPATAAEQQALASRIRQEFDRHECDNLPNGVDPHRRPTANP